MLKSATAVQVAEFLTTAMSNTALGKVSAWATVPPCLLRLDKQLRNVMVDPHHDDVPLLGNVDDGAFVLGYVQVSNMPAPLRSTATPSELDAAKVVQLGRRLGLHNDPGHCTLPGLEPRLSHSHPLTPMTGVRVPVR
eukprot:6870716-Prymnesium_polylepis.2